MSAVSNASEIASGDPKARRRMSTGQRILFFVTAWLIVLMPFLFWWNTWFGRQLSDKQVSEYLHDDKKPRHIQHALVQIGARMSQHDASVTRWYPDVVRLASYPVEEVRNTDAWVMGQDTSVAGFHEALLKMLNDSSLMVRGNAALSLVRFGDATGRPQIVQLLQPIQIRAPGGKEKNSWILALDWEPRSFAPPDSRGRLSLRDLNRHHPDFFFHFGRIHHRDGIPRAAIEEASIRPFADALLAADAENRINLNAPKRRMVLVRHPEHAVFHRAIFDAGRRPGAAGATLGDDG